MTQDTSRSSDLNSFNISTYINFLGEPKQTKRGLRYKCPNCGVYYLAIHKEGIKYDCHNCHETKRIAYLLRQINGEIPEKGNNSDHFTTNAKKENKNKTSEFPKLPKAVELNNFIKLTYPDLRYNSHSQEIWLGDKIFSKAVCKLERLSAHIADKYGKDYPKERCIDAVMLHAERNPFNPLQDYLKACKKKFEKMIGFNIERCDQEASNTLSALSTTYLGTQSRLYDEYLKLFILSAVGRALYAGCYVRQVLILQGEQGIGKTSFLGILGGKWFTNSVVDAKGKDELMIAIKHWLIEWGELEHLWGRKTVEVVKAFITRTKDDLRLPYGRDIESIERRFILCGSTNKAEFLTDETGNDRFWVIPVPTKINLEAWELAKEEILGAACYLVDQAYNDDPKSIMTGKFWRLSESLHQVNLDNTRQFEEGDDWENILQPYLDLQKLNEYGGWIESKLIWQQLDIEMKDSRKYSNQINKVMTRLGWLSKRKKIEGKTYRGWQSKEKR